MKVREIAATVFEGSHQFAVADLEGTLGEADGEGVRTGSGHVKLSAFDRSRDPRGLGLEIKLAGGGLLVLTFQSWDRKAGSGRVELFLLPASKDQDQGPPE